MWFLWYCSTAVKYTRVRYIGKLRSRFEYLSNTIEHTEASDSTVKSSAAHIYDLKELDMDLLDARASAQNRPLWRIIAKHGATLP